MNNVAMFRDGTPRRGLKTTAQSLTRGLVRSLEHHNLSRRTLGLELMGRSRSFDKPTARAACPFIG